MKKTIKISEHYQWPILTSNIIKDLATNTVMSPTDLECYLLKPNNVELKVRQAVNVGVTPLKMWNRVRDMQIKKTTAFKKFKK